MAPQDPGSENAPSGKNQGPVTLALEEDTENLNALGDVDLEGLGWPAPLPDRD